MKAFVYIILLFSYAACSDLDDQSLVLPGKKNCAGCKHPSQKKSIATNASLVSKADSDNAGMVWIHGVTFQMGSDEFADAMPVHAVTLSSFLMDEHEVTNAEFA
jgi:formylglycine-generating enzyme required for sulfatase activity